MWWSSISFDLPRGSRPLPHRPGTALAYGWIDGHRKALDGDSFLQRYSPRQRRSPWSAINATPFYQIPPSSGEQHSGRGEGARGSAQRRF